MLVMKEELDVSLGIVPSWVVAQEIKLFYIGISDKKMISLLNLKDTNKKCVDLSGVLMNSNLHQEAMIISF